MQRIIFRFLMILFSAIFLQAQELKPGKFVLDRNLLSPEQIDDLNDACGSLQETTGITVIIKTYANPVIKNLKEKYKKIPADVVAKRLHAGLYGGNSIVIVLSTDDAGSKYKLLTSSVSPNLEPRLREPDFTLLFHQLPNSEAGADPQSIRYNALKYVLDGIAKLLAESAPTPTATAARGLFVHLH